MNITGSSEERTGYTSGNCEKKGEGGVGRYER